MLSKCANPGCPASFLYLHQGKLFRLDTSHRDCRQYAGSGDEEAFAARRIFLAVR